MKLNSIEDLLKVKLPLVVLQDVEKRIGDWLASGGNVEDLYVKQQLKYAERFIGQ